MEDYREQSRRDEMRPEGVNRTEHYTIRRKEFGHGESGNLSPGRTETYGEQTFRGYSLPPTRGRNYEDDAGYRDSYHALGRSRDTERDGTHRGKGPRAYRRTDARILEDINDRLCDNPYLDASEMEVNVEGGDVVLTGVVESREAKRLAEDIGESVSGVKNVENRLRVRKDQ